MARKPSSTSGTRQSKKTNKSSSSARASKAGEPAKTSSGQKKSESDKGSGSSTFAKIANSPTVRNVFAAGLLSAAAALLFNKRGQSNESDASSGDMATGDTGAGSSQNIGATEVPSTPQPVAMPVARQKRAGRRATGVKPQSVDADLPTISSPSDKDSAPSGEIGQKKRKGKSVAAGSGQVPPAPRKPRAKRTAATAADKPRRGRPPGSSKVSAPKMPVAPPTETSTFAVTAPVSAEQVEIRTPESDS